MGEELRIEFAGPLLLVDRERESRLGQEPVRENLDARRGPEDLSARQDDLAVGSVPEAWLHGEIPVGADDSGLPAVVQVVVPHDAALLIAKERHHAIGRVDGAGERAGHIGPGTAPLAVEASVQVGSVDQCQEVRGGTSPKDARLRARQRLRQPDVRPAEFVHRPDVTGIVLGPGPRCRWDVHSEAVTSFLGPPRVDGRAAAVQSGHSSR
ncbi:hypothetical protein ACFWIZ_12060 [Streptomyces sp. NPDC127044]